MAQKRGGGVPPAPLEEDSGDPGPPPDAAYEQAVFDAKVEASLRALERDSDFADFEIYRMRVLDGMSGRHVASSLGVSEPTVSRRLGEVRKRLRVRLFEVFARYSFTPEEIDELERNGLDPNPNKDGEAGFDEAVAEIYHRSCLRRAAEGTVVR